MKVWLTSGQGAAAVAEDALGTGHDVHVSDGTIDLGDPAQVASLVSGTEAVVHTIPLSTAAMSDEEILEQATRGAYVVLDEAVKAGVKRAVLLSDLTCFDDHYADYVIDETWRPDPRPEAVRLVPVLVERTFREFARQGGIDAVCLRFGEIDAPDGTPRALAARAVERAVTAELKPGGYRWHLFHVVGSERFPLRVAKGEPLSLGEDA